MENISKKSIVVISLLTMVGLMALPIFGLKPVENAPQIVKFLGRFHPVILHMPIGIIFLIATMEAMAMFRIYRPKFDMEIPMLFGALSAIVAVILGFMLYQGDAFEGKIAERHFWGGTIVAVLAVAAFLAKYLVDSQSNKGNIIYQGLVFATCGVMMFASHDGASMVHGENYLTEHAPASLKAIMGVEDKPKDPGAKEKPIAERVVFTSTVAPILEAKCYICHSEEKQKGKLRLDTFEAILKGGSEGTAIVAGDAKKSTLVTRIHLPLDDEEHMPPKEKQQVEKYELEIIEWWINQGASATATFAELKADEKITALLAKMIPPAELKKMEDEAAAAEAKAQADSEAKRKDLETSMVSVKKSFPGALNFTSKLSSDLTFSAVSMRSKFTDEDLKKLVPVATGVVWLDLTATNITDASAPVLSQFKNLQNLKVGETKLTDASAKSISQLSSLTSLNLIKTEITDASLESIKALPYLKNLYLWESKITPAAIDALKKARPELNVVSDR